MTGTSLDILAIADELEAAGFERIQALAIARACGQGHGDHASKAEVACLKSEISSVRWAGMHVSFLLTGLVIMLLLFVVLSKLT